MAEEVTKIMRSEESKTRLDAMGAFPSGGTPEEFDGFIATETAKWAKVIKDEGVKPD
jgi:tripartite-type tricarboxylate transporter receptor subunit TctC